MINKKQSYYAAIVEREKAKQALINSQIEKECKSVNYTLKDDIGSKMYDAFLGILNMLANLKVSDTSKNDNNQLNEVLELKRDISSFINRVDKTLIEIFRLNEMQYEMIAKLTNSSVDRKQFFISDKVESSYKSISESSKYLSAKTSTKRAKIPKSATRERLLEIANELKSSGGKTSLTEISKVSGIPYHKVVYACKDFAEFQDVISSNTN